MQAPTIRRDRGFTMLELLLVTAIIAIVAAVALPSLAASRKAAAEGNVISTLRMAVTINELYRNRFGDYAAIPEDWVDADLIPHSDDGTIEAGPRGYSYSYNNAGNGTWTLGSAPLNPGVTGDRAFFVDQTGVIRFSTVGEAHSGSPAVD